ncbi:MAG: FAD:protein FMN transferase [Bacteroidales bacterium]|nr:FAD:protein FMN transferase [Bacteroidales bacterium]MCF8389749.1 FAD:protein FMN transferase [Bacteroidales bacterium]
MRIFSSLLIFTVLLFSSCNTERKSLVYYKISGFTQGTTYHMIYAVKDSFNLQDEVDSLLHDFDMSLSSYEPNSMLSKLNRNESNIVDENFIKLYEAATSVNAASEGAFDITVMPLVNAWGFGPGLKTEIDSFLIDSLLQLVGMEKIRLEGNRLIKANPDISIDVNAIAQGFSVDVIAGYFDQLEIENYMVEIGGELITKGLNAKGTDWRVGIDRPEFGNIYPGADLEAIISLSGKALATSGNYRKFYEEDGVKYSHSINPKTGYPEKSDLLSATIIADNCMLADAYATACMVMGLEKSKLLIKATDGVEAYLIYGDEDGKYQVYYSEGFKKYIFKEM